ncbi:MAG: ABC transporter permease [Cetobacterium sp.]
MKLKKENFYSLGGIFFLLIFWEILGKYIIAKQYILPWPTIILEFIFENLKALFLVHLPYTLLITVISLGISLVLGIVLAVLMDEYKTLEKILYPIIVTSQTLPITAIAPIFILWFGYSIWSKVTVAVLMIFFPITINVHSGLRGVKKEYLDLFNSMKASKKDIFFKLKVPSALPYFISSIKMAFPLSLIGATIGEWLGAARGLGYYSKRMMTQLNGPGVFAPIVIISLLATFLVLSVNYFEKKYIHWRKE